jgi:hypothetical protein
MGLINFLFGKEVVFSDPLLGELKTRSRKKTSNCTWSGETQLKGQKGKTVFILEGNGIEPLKEQLSSIRKIVSDLDQIIVEITNAIKNSTNYFRKSNWINDFHLAAITPIHVADNSFEIIFEPIDDSSLNYIWCDWSNGKVSNFEFKL